MSLSDSDRKINATEVIDYALGKRAEPLPWSPTSEAARYYDFAVAYYNGGEPPVGGYPWAEAKGLDPEARMSVQSVIDDYKRGALPSRWPYS